MVAMRFRSFSFPRCLTSERSRASPIRSLLAVEGFEFIVVVVTEDACQAPAGSLGRRRVAQELSWVLLGVKRAGAEVDQEPACRLGLRPLGYNAVSHIMTGPAPWCPARFGDRPGTSTGSANELVDRLERARYLIRRPHPQDRLGLQPGDAAVTGVLGSLRPLRERIDAPADEFTAEVSHRSSRAALGRMPLSQLRTLGGSTITEHSG